MKTFKLWSCLVFCLLLLGLVASAPALAAEDIDQTKDVSLTLQAVYDGEALPGATFELYYVASATGNVVFKLAGDFASCPVSFSNLDIASWNAMALTLAGYAKDHSLKPLDQATTDAAGRLKFPATVSSLKPGLYLVTDGSCTVGDYQYEAAPFLICLPNRSSIDSAWEYSVTAYPKYTRREIVTPPISIHVQKLWDDKGYEDGRPEKITVKLLKDGKLYDRVSLSKSNNWRYTWDDLDATAEWLVVEITPDGYTMSVSRTDDTFLITNTIIPPIPPIEPPVEPPIPPIEPPVEPPLPPIEPPVEPPTPPELPQTGQLWWPVPALFAAGLLMILGWMWIRRKNSAND